MAVVYKITSPKGKIYIGVSIQLHIRIARHKRTDSYVGRAFRKYKDGMSVEVIYEGSIEDCYELEELIVDKEFTESEDTYNLALGGIIPKVLGTDWRCSECNTKTTWNSKTCKPCYYKKATVIAKAECKDCGTEVSKYKRPERCKPCRNIESKRFKYKCKTCNKPKKDGRRENCVSCARKIVTNREEI